MAPHHRERPYNETKIGWIDGSLLLKMPTVRAKRLK
jgi:hypothetical protein